MKKRNKMLIVPFLTTIIALSGCSITNKPVAVVDEVTIEADKDAASSEEQENTEYGLIGFETINLGEETVTQSIFEEYDITMVNIWGTFCGPCIREMPDLQALYENIPEGTNLIGIISDASLEEIVEDAKTIVEQTGVTYQNLIPDQVLYNFLVENVTGVPSTIFVDKEGKIIGDMIVGARSEKEYRELISQALEAIGK